MIVKAWVTIVVIAATLFIACTKQKSDKHCSVVTITDSAEGCGGWGIVVNGTKYPSGNIPVEFQQDGLTVCADYELYEDLRMCICCGGTWVNIKSIKKL
jgi:hypothetical protein